MESCHNSKKSRLWRSSGPKAAWTPSVHSSRKTSLPSATTRWMHGRNGVAAAAWVACAWWLPGQVLISWCRCRSQLGNTWRATGNVTRALQCFRKALFIKPTDPDVLLNMAVVMQNLRHVKCVPGLDAV